MLDHIFTVVYRMLYQELGVVFTQVSAQLTLSQSALEIHVVYEAVEVDHPSHAEEREMPAVAHREHCVQRGMLTRPYGCIVCRRMPISVAWESVLSLISHCQADTENCRDYSVPEWFPDRGGPSQNLVH